MGVILAAMVVFSPWAFGTTQPWSIRLMNIAGYALGVLLLAKVLLRRHTPLSPQTASFGRRFTLTLLALTFGILAYVLVAAINAEFTYVPKEFRADPHPFIEWLPHSLDRLASWRVFWNWLALACVFWAAHSWLIGDVTEDGRRTSRRVRGLIFILAINGALVAFEGILQRMSDTPKLLWFQVTHDNPSAAAQFGPYAYRANAAQLFNLIWPIALGLWWHLHLRAEATSRRAQRHHWLIPCVMLLIVAPLISLSRGGAGVAMIQMVACGCLILAGKQFNWPARIGVLFIFALTAGAAWYLGGDLLAERLHGMKDGPLAGRSETYQLAARMAVDYPWFGVGPGAFDSVFQLYRNSPGDYWPAQLHNDWLEYLITFGRVGCALLVAAGLVVLARWFVPRGVRLHSSFAAFVWIALGGCLLHARVDFPLQIYSIQFVFVLLCAILFSVSRDGALKR